MYQVLALDRYGPDSLPRRGLRGCAALMLGSEFCDGLLPSPEEFAAVRRLFPGNLILATPVLPQAALEAVLELVDRAAPDEVAANDLGLLEALRSRRGRRPRVSCGRLLSHRVKIMPDADARAFLARYSLASFEVDDPRVIGRLAPYGLPFSWHHPFRFATVTRFCPWERRWGTDCAHSCRGRMAPLQSLRVARTLWLKGGAYFVRAQRARRGMMRNVLTPPEPAPAPAREL